MYSCDGNARDNVLDDCIPDFLRGFQFFDTISWRGCTVKNGFFFELINRLKSDSGRAVHQQQYQRGKRNNPGYFAGPHDMLLVRMNVPEIRSSLGRLTPAGSPPS